MNQTEQIVSKIQTWDQARQTVSEWEEKGLKVVFSNGCFDLVHKGHVDYLARARDLGDKLVIGLNSDASVSLLKGNARPVVDQDSRAFLLAGFSFIDLVVIFDEDTPYELVKLLQPDILVKGNDYKPEDIAGYDVVMAKGGEVITVELVEGYSTTALIDRIKKAF
ncbi:D-glycero-beta-D-manno-heptose 1-phosphate adenylyltransferase [Saccharicrinis sp. FJH62]|uniref:D-glycero-beta-D-manno-heptose 1-phosphate adenylyltransferase n=1 Tax=Saccharicrinis sp. FJH62 TaxID=3344657 RepID=UPI0035D443AD